jgi:hypothetical protein
MLLRLIPLLLASHLISSPNPFHFLFFSLVKVPMLSFYKLAWQKKDGRQMMEQVLTNAA